MELQLLESEFRSHKRALVRAARRIMRDEAAAEDIVQWAFMRAITSEFEGRSAPRTWLHQIVVNKCKEVRRQTLARGHIDAKWAPVPTNYDIESVVDARQQIEKLSSLPDRDLETICVWLDENVDHLYLSRMFRLRIKLREKAARSERRLQ